MRNVPRRFFTVEAKSGGRRTSTIIPTRVTAPQPPSRASLFMPEPASAEPVTEKRRVLPSLIVPEVPQVELEPSRDEEVLPVRRPRGRPRKLQPTCQEPAAAVPQEVTPAVVIEKQAVVAPVQPAATPLRERKNVPAADLPRGERWKTRRLGRWSR